MNVSSSEAKVESRSKSSRKNISSGYKQKSTSQLRSAKEEKKHRKPKESLKLPYEKPELGSVEKVGKPKYKSTDIE